MLGDLILSAVIFFAHTDAYIPFTISFGYAHSDVGIFGAADIRPVSFAMMEAVCDTVRHTFSRTESVAHADGLTVEALIITILGGETV